MNDPSIGHAAHPRSRGENLLFDNTGKDLPGSSPLTRGKQAASEADFWAAGLIPAHAGKTSAPPLASSPVTAHPRSRGENTTGSHSAGEPPGSSPLTRGKQ